MRAARLFAYCTTALAGALLTTPIASAPAVASAPAAAKVPADAQQYVALGDSYASIGSLSRMYIDPATGCLRSTDNYPARVAEGVGDVELVDATCAGAVTDDVLSKQLGPLTSETDLVTLSIAGNDIGFGDILATCALLSTPAPEPTPCEDHYTENGTDQLAETIADAAPKVDAVLTAINERAPRAAVIVTGYLRILPPDTGCWPAIPIAPGDLNYLNDTQDALNAMVRERTEAVGYAFVDPSTVEGHDACQPPAQRWVDGLFPLADGTPAHPTAAGQQHVSELVRGEWRPAKKTTVD